MLLVVNDQLGRASDVVPFEATMQAGHPDDVHTAWQMAHQWRIRSQAQRRIRSQPQLSVNVSKVTGEQLTFVADAQTSIRELRYMIAKRGLPSSCILLASKFSNEPLQDSELVANHADDDRSVELSLVMSMDLVYRSILSERGREKVDAIHALASLSPLGSVLALTTFRTCFEDISPCVRQAAIEGVTKLADAENKLLLRQVKLRLEDKDEMVRQAAAEALAKLESLALARP